MMSSFQKLLAARHILETSQTNHLLFRNCQVSFLRAKNCKYLISENVRDHFCLVASLQVVFQGLKIYSDTRFENARACVFDYSKSLAQLASKLIFTENNRWVPLLLSNSKKLSDLIITKLENFPLNLALLDKHFCTFTCCCQIVTLAGAQNVDH